MAGPITWQSLTAPSLAEAAYPLALAQRTFAGGFDALGNALKEYQTGQQEVWKKQDTEATQAILNQIYQTRTPEEFNALQAQGLFSKAVADNGARINLGDVNRAIDGRVNTLEQRALQSREASDKQRVFDEAPKIGAATSLLYQKDFDGARQAMTGLSPQAQGVFANEMQKYERELAVRAQTDNKAKEELLNFQAQRAKWTADTVDAEERRGIDKERNAIQRISAEAQRDQVNLATGERLEKRLTDLVSQRERLSTEGATLRSNAGQKYIEDRVQGFTKDENTRTRLMEAVAKIKGNAEFAEYKASDITAALLGDISTGSALRRFVWDGTGDGLVSMLRKMGPPVKSEADEARTRALGDLDQQILVLKTNLGYPTATSTPKPNSAGDATAEAGKNNSGQIAPPPKPGTTSVQVATDLNELARQRQDVAAGIRANVDPALEQKIQSSAKAVADETKKFQETIDARRKEVAEKNGLKVIERPDHKEFFRNLSPAEKSDFIGRSAANRFDEWVRRWKAYEKRTDELLLQQGK